MTGGIGSGKSTLCKILVESGKAQLYIADVRAKELMHEDSVLREELIRAFGEECYCNGALNRGYLSSVVFSSPERLAQLNSIVHPRVRADFEQWLKGCTTELAIMESAILFESGFDDLADIKIAVLAPTKLRIDRVAKRDSLTREQIEERIKAQLSDDELQRLSDICVVNIVEEDLHGSAERIIQLSERWGR